MHSIKPGRGPSAMSGMAGIFGVIFGIFWTIMAVVITQGSPFPVVGIVFPLFGVLFVIMGIVRTVYDFRNASAKDRFSLMDITSPGEESDPLDEAFGRGGRAIPTGGSVESRLKELGSLRQQGLISEDEYSSQRQRILGGL